MTEEDFETFMYIGTKKMLICVFSKIDSKILYKNESKILELNNHIDENKIVNFLSENIFKIEKQLNQFINDISLIIDNNQFQLIDVSIKQNIYGEANKKNLLNLIKDLKNYIFDSYNDCTLIHYVVNHYLFDNNVLKNFNYSKKCDHLGLDTTFILLKKDEIFFYQKIFEKFQISVNKIMSGKYIFDFFDFNELNECEMGRKISSGFNPNEVFLFEKKIEKKGFFERFFNLFS